MPSKPISPENLIEFATSVYLALGLRREDAELLADTLVQADLWGHQSHGVMRTFWYGKRIVSGATKALATPEVVKALTRTGSGLVTCFHIEIGDYCRARNHP